MPQFKVEHHVELIKTQKKILGLGCDRIELTEKISWVENNEKIPQITHFTIYATKQIHPAITIQPLMMLQKEVLYQYTPLAFKATRNNNTIYNYIAVNISK